MTFALIGRRESRWLESVASRCRRECARLDIEAPLNGDALLVDDERVQWQGFDLLGAEAVLLERPTFSWPQPGASGRALPPQAEREARALVVSALFAAARAVRLLDPPDAAQLAVAPLVALERCARAGLAVQPFELVPARPSDEEHSWLDPAGTDLWLAARAPEAGQPAWRPAPFEAPVLSILSVGGAVVGARRHASAAAWIAGADAERLGGDEVDGSELAETTRAAALAAQRALGLSWLQTDLYEAPEGPRLLRALPGVDLGPWERELEGGPSAALAALLTGDSPTPAER